MRCLWVAFCVLGDNMNYSDKLKDPRWDEKRKEILARDDFKCQLCRSKNTELHVHHKYYLDVEPWEHPDNCLISLCADCHDEEHAKLTELDNHILNAFRQSFMADDISKIMLGFMSIKPDHVPGMSAEMLCWFLSNREAMDIGLRMHFMVMEKPKK